MRHDVLIRALSMIAELKSSRLTLEQLARKHDVSTRTVRRDLEAMSVAGVTVLEHYEPGEPMAYSVRERA